MDRGEVPRDREMALMGSVCQYFISLFARSAPAPAAMVDQVKDAIKKGITDPLGLAEGAAIALLSQSSLETRAWKSPVFSITHSLFNRHAGSGRGEWTGKTYYATRQDPDLRIYTDIYQSARDMAQLLQDPLYRDAFAALKQADLRQYAQAIARAGFAESDSYAQDIVNASYGYV